MRSRYSAFVKRDEPYLLRTWHPRTRPARVEFDPGMRWTGLEILETGDGYGVPHHRDRDLPGLLPGRMRCGSGAGSSGSTGRGCTSTGSRRG